MLTIYREEDADPGLILEKRVGVIGYGSQGHAHALNLRDSGVEVCVGLREDSASRARAVEAGLAVGTAAEIAEWAEVVALCTPDETTAGIYREEIAASLKPGNTLLFAHGFNIHYGFIEPAPEVDVVLVAPKGPGRALRSEFLAGGGLAAYMAVHQDAWGAAQATALAYAWGIGCARVGVIPTTFREETETDLFGEQAVLCGGIPALIKAGFETLLDAGYSPVGAYYECVLEAKLIVDLPYEGGLKHMRESISDTAEWGGFLAEGRIDTEGLRAAMKQILEEVRTGNFAREWVEEAKLGKPRLAAFRAEEEAHPAEAVGKELRDSLGWPAS